MPNFSPPPSLLLVVICILCIFSGRAAQSANSHTRVGIISKWCRNTSYPALCNQYLSIFPKSITQSPEKIARAGLLVSLYRTQITRSYINKVLTKLKALSKFKEYQVVKDCLEVLSDEVYELSESIKELYQLRGGHGKGDDENCDVGCHVSNIQNFLSSALTDASTCVDELGEFVRRKHLGRLMATIKAKALNAEQATTVSLDLFCLFAKCSNQLF